MKPRNRKMLGVAGALAALAISATLVLNAFRSNLVFFMTPSQIAAGEAPRDRALRIGGLVEANSLQRQPDALTVRFVVTDTITRIPVVYRGILPDLFREGKGVVAQGRLDAQGVFRASEVLAKHDENYMPPEAAAALRAAQSGREQIVRGLAVEKRAK